MHEMLVKKLKTPLHDYIHLFAHQLEWLQLPTVSWSFLSYLVFDNHSESLIPSK